MPRNSQRKRFAPAMQPTYLDEERQTPNVVGVSVGDPNRVEIRKAKAKIQELRAARLPGIQQDSLASKLEENAGLKTSGSDVAWACAEKS
jgi:hypothetical protein